MPSLYLGLDLGSVSLDSVVVDGDGRVIWADYTRTVGQPLKAAINILERIYERFSRREFVSCLATGSGAPTLARLIEAETVNEIVALAKGAAEVAPRTRSIIDMGGEDAKLILVSPGPAGSLRIDDFAMNTMCAAGTGSFLDQQANRLGMTIERFGEVACQSENPPRLAGRCSVFAKTDMIHLQQEATPDYDIVAGLCFAMARNLKSNIAKGKKIIPPVCFTGGVAANLGVRRALTEVMDLAEGELIVPELHGCVGALGAALVAVEEAAAGRTHPPAELDNLARGAAESAAGIRRLDALSLSNRHLDGPVAPAVPDGPLEGYLGVDVGSISTNVVVIDKDMNLLGKQYLLTAGRPLDAVKEGLARIGREIGDRLTILGAGTTGSGRYLTADFIGADLVKNEITAQASASAAIDPEVDTIFEIGGQDSKYISLSDGAIVDFNMNKVCAAGTGSFLEEQAEKLGLAIKEEFGRRALSASAPTAMGERCTVFMESDLVALQAAGAEIDDLVAGLCYSIVHNYLNKVVEDRPVGRKIFYQGATAANRGIVAAFEKVVGRPITVPPNHDVTGAIGVALLAMRERTWKKSKFKGFQLSESNYVITTFECKGCPNTCSIRKVVIEGEKRPLFYGSRCDKYDVDQRAETKLQAPDLPAKREELLLSYVGPVKGERRGVIGLPRTMFFREYMPFFSTFCQELGFEPHITGPSNKKLIHAGVEVMVNEPCFPIKAAHGHLRELIEAGVKNILLPSPVSLESPGHPGGAGQVCPYAQTLCYTAPASLGLSANGTGRGARLITAPLRFGEGDKALLDGLKQLARQMGAAEGDVPAAMVAAKAAQADFSAQMKELGRAALADLGPDEKAMVIVSRPYNGADPGLNLGLPEKMRALGVQALPMDCLDLDSKMGEPELAEMYWRYGQKILAAGLICRDDPRLYPVYITNFGCGPDSFILHFFRQIMNGKPFLEIEIDEHSADVGAITRLEAFLDSLPNASAQAGPSGPVKRRQVNSQGRSIFIPSMADHAEAVAAAFRACGVEATAMPESDERTKELGRRYTSGKECYPCALTTGDMLKILMDDGADPDKTAFFMPSGTGPCRFGQYHRFQRLVLDELGYDRVQIYAPDQSETLYRDLGVVGGKDFTRLAWQGLIGVDLLTKAVLELRPYEKEPGATDRLYRDQLKLWAETVEKRGDQVAAMERAAKAFAALPRDDQNHKPVIGVVGEIYTRANRYANEDLIRTIEALGGRAWMPTIAEWIFYTNWASADRSRRIGAWRDFLVMKLENYFQTKDERRLGRPWAGLLKTLHDPKISQILDLARPYLDPSFEGEAILSMGKSRDMLGRGAAGVINVIPFSCMPGTICTALMKRFREDHGELPVLTLSMDGQEQTGTRTRLEAFVHQVRQFNQA